MKTLSNNKGIALIILIVAMTLIAVMGAGFVTLMGTKYIDISYQNNSYRAANIANAGIEYAIRYVGENSDGTLGDFFHVPANYTNIAVVSTVPDISNLTDTNQWRSREFGGGRFYLSYYIDPLQPDEVSSNKVLYSVGIYGNSTRVVRLQSFLIYATPPSSIGLDILNLVPNQRPYILGNSVNVPIINVSSGNARVSSIQLEIHFDVPYNRNFSGVYYFNNINLTGGWDEYISYRDGYPRLCSSDPARPCYQGNNVEIPDSPLPHGALATSPLPMYYNNVDIQSGYIRWFSFRFVETNANLKGTYSITFNLLGGGSSTVKFYLSYL